MRILVIGGTGTVGTQVVSRLLNKGADIAVMTRSEGKSGMLPAGASSVRGDLEKPNTLSKAFSGVERVFLLTAVVQNETAQGLAAVEAAKKAGVKRIVYMSVHQLDSAPHIPHFATKIPIERAIRESGMEYTFLRPNNFYQVDLWFREAIAERGVYPQPIGSKGLSRVDVRDIADAVSATLLKDGHNRQTYAIVGPDILTGDRVAEIWSRHLGRPVRYAGDDLGEWMAQAAKSMPGWMASDLRIMYDHFQKHGLAATDEEIRTLERVIGHAPIRFESFVTEIAPEWKSAGKGRASASGA